MTDAQVQQHLTDHHGIAVGNGFPDSEPPQALLDVRGKSILKASGGSAVMGQFDAGPVDVAREMDPAAIPEDIKTFLGMLTSQA